MSSRNKWDLGNPRLWYRDDLVNHPELMPLEGQTIDISKVGSINKVYPGSVLLTEKITRLHDNVFTNGRINVNVDMYKGLYTPSGLFEEPISISNIAHVSEQWLTGDNDITKQHFISIELNDPVLLTEYWMIAAIGTKDRIDAKYPTPKQWIVYGSKDNDKWDIVDKRNELSDNWKSWKINSYKVTCNTDYKYYKFVFTEWHPTEDEDAISTGLKRLYVFGRPINQFILPDIPSPDDSFVWVITKKEIK
jgi:hypothetical protein